jgi:pimeloyl-ACP methyl ester carboxylesterase
MSLIALILAASLSFAAPKILFQNHRIHTVKTSDNVGLKVLELLGPGARAMKDARPIVLMHGYTNNWNGWHLIADQYRQQGLRVFIVNWRGHGQGEHRSVVVGERFDTMDERYDFHHLATIDVPTVINFAYEISGKQKVIYQSHSMGGMMANLAFAGVSFDERGEVAVSLKVGHDFEKKVAAYIPIAAPNSMRFKEYPGLDYFEYWMNLIGIRGDRSDNIDLPLDRLRHRTGYWMVRANPFAHGLVNLENMTVDEYVAMLEHGVSDVPRALSDSIGVMRREGYASPSGVNYETISQLRSRASFHKTKIPILMISADSDVLALIDQQVPLARRRACSHVRLPGAGHMDILLGAGGAKEVVEASVSFIRGLGL